MEDSAEESGPAAGLDFSLLEAASRTQYEGHELEWLYLVEKLKLPFSYLDLVMEIIREDRWRKAENRVAYIRKAAQRQAPKQSIDGVPRVSDLKFAPEITHDEAMDLLSLPYALVPRDDAHPFDSLPDDLVSDDGTPAWRAIAKRLRLDPDERKLLTARLRGTTRDAAPKKLRWPKNKVEAVWKRLNRSLAKLKDMRQSEDDRLDAIEEP